MKRIDMGFVVLHYQAFDMTVECIKKIERTFSKCEYFITVVDNKSPNGSGTMLESMFIDNEKVKVICSKENLGFAKGNNLGYKYLRENFQCTFIVVMNNDVLIEQENFYDILNGKYMEKPFLVAGPDIFAPKMNTHQNPIRKAAYSREEILKSISILERQLKIYPLVWCKSRLGPIKRKVMGMLLRKNSFEKPWQLENLSGCMLHGACFIFSNEFIKVEENAFNPCSFMFCEEIILSYYLCQKYGIDSIEYIPHLKVTHLEDVSTDTIFRSSYGKDHWKDRESFNSLRNFAVENGWLCN